MRLVELTLTEFQHLLGSKAPAPGGGSAAALSAVTGISLTKMVCELTLGKKKYQAYQEEISHLHQESMQLQSALLVSIDKDTEVFNSVSAVFSMPKESDEEKVARQDALQTALKSATESPFEMMQLMVRGLHLTQQLVGKSNTNAISDLGVAALSLKAGLQGAWLNVLINLSSLKDETFVRDYKERAQDLLGEGCRVADAIYENVEREL